MATAAATMQTSPKSSGRQQTESRLEELLDQTASAFGKRLSPIEAEAHLQAWARLDKKFGRSRFEEGLKRAIAEVQFFPRLEQIESRVPEAKLIGRTDLQCPACEGTGWERVFAGLTVGGEDRRGNSVDPKLGAVRRCACWHKVDAAA